MAIRTLPDGREEISRIPLNTVLTGEPDASLFFRSMGYWEVPLSEPAVLASAAGRAEPNRVAGCLRRLDSSYHAH